MSSFWLRVQTLKGKTLQTRSQGKLFDVQDVSSDRIVVLPRDGNGTSRSISREMLEHIAALALDESELHPIRLRQEFPNDQNLSYLAAIAHAAQSK